MNDVWQLHHTPERITLHSATRMPHSSRRGPMDAARRALRTALGSLEPGPAQVLEGTYCSSLDGFFDVENIVIYNIEPASFRSAGRNGLRARRSRLAGGEIPSGYDHTLDYYLVPRPPAPSDPLVELVFRPDSLRSVFAVWWAANNGTLVRAAPVSSRFGLHVELGGPVPPPNPASKLKILFDGIIAALQADAEPDPVAVARLARRHGLASELIAARLRAPITQAIAGARGIGLVRPYRAGVQWHPADDQCEECTLLVNWAAEPICRAYLYALPAL